MIEEKPDKYKILIKEDIRILKKKIDLLLKENILDKNERGLFLPYFYPNIEIDKKFSFYEYYDDLKNSIFHEYSEDYIPNKFNDFLEKLNKDVEKLFITRLKIFCKKNNFISQRHILYGGAKDKIIYSIHYVKFTAIGFEFL